MTTSTETAPSNTGTKQATIHRMVMPDHVCPYGTKTLDLLERKGFDIDDRHLETDEETTAFREKWGVETTPQTFVDGELVGTLDDVREYVGGSSNVPLGFVSFTENVAMVAMAIWMGAKHLI